MKKEILLREGYEVMASESKRIMDDFKHLDRESEKYMEYSLPLVGRVREGGVKWASLGGICYRDKGYLEMV